MTKKQVTIPFQTKDFPIGTLIEILKQAGIDRRDIRYAGDFFLFDFPSRVVSSIITVEIIHCIYLINYLLFPSYTL
jgi:hypothetical protein